MVTSQRLITMIIGFQLIIGLAVTISENPSEYSPNAEQHTYLDDLLEGKEQEVKSDPGLLGGIKSIGSRLWESTPVNAIKVGLSLVKVLVNGINPISISYNDVDTEIEKIFIVFLAIFRTLLMFIAGLEAYFIFKNNKNT